MKRLLLACLLAAPVAVSAAAEEPPAEAELALEASRLRRFAAEAKWSDGLGVFFPYEEVAAGLSGADRAWAGAYSLLVCQQAQAISRRGAYHLERHRLRYQLAHADDELKRSANLDAIASRLGAGAGMDVPQGDELREGTLARHRLWERGRRVRLAALARVVVEDGLGPLDELTASAGTDYQVVRASCPPPPAR